MKKSIALLTVLCLVVTMLAACGTKEPTEGTTPQPYKIAFAVNTLADESVVFMNKVTKEYVESLGYEFISYDAGGDAAKQADQISQAIASQVDAILTIPIDATALAPALKKAKNEGIKVVNCQLMLEDESAFDAYVGPDDRAAGEVAGQALMEVLPEGSKVVVVQGQAGSSAQIMRDEGFDKATGGYFEVLGKKASPWDPAVCMSITEDFLVANPDIQGIFCHWDGGAVAVIQALKAANRSDIKVVACDGCYVGFESIKAGDQYATAMLDFSTDMKKSVDVAVTLLDGGTVDPKVQLSTPLKITKDNVDDIDPGW